jgi:hypothetical protein
MACHRRRARRFSPDTASRPRGRLNRRSTRCRSTLPTSAENVPVSCRNINRPGWCYVSDFGNYSTSPIGDEQIYALKLDGSRAVEVFGVDHGSPNVDDTDNSYTTRAVPSRDGRRVLFDSD